MLKLLTNSPFSICPQRQFVHDATIRRRRASIGNNGLNIARIVWCFCDDHKISDIMNFECANVMQCEIVCFVCHTKHIHFHKMLDGIKIKSISTKKQTTLFSTLAISFTSCSTCFIHVFFLNATQWNICKNSCQAFGSLAQSTNVMKTLPNIAQNLLDQMNYDVNKTIHIVATLVLFHRYPRFNMFILVQPKKRKMANVLCSYSLHFGRKNLLIRFYDFDVEKQVDSICKFGP